MAIASVRVRIVDGGLRATRSTTRPPAVVGCSSGGSAGQVALLSSVEDCIATYGHGKLTELVAMYLALAGVPVLACKAASSTAGSCGSVTQPSSPAAQLTVTVDTARDDYRVLIRVTRAAANLAALTAAVKISLDAGVTFGPEIAVPSTGTIVLGDTGITVDYADGTFAVGDDYSFTSTAPIWNTAALTAALTVLGAQSIDHEFIHVAEHAVRADASAVLTALDGLADNGVYRRALLATRDQGSGESVSTWQTVLLGGSPGFALLDGEHYLDVVAGFGTIRSRTTGALHRRSVAWVIGPRLAYLRTQITETIAGVAEHPGAVHLGAIAGIEEGTLVHDLRLLPSLDAGGFMGLQTHIGRAGYFATDRTMAQEPSDFSTVMNARVIVEAARTAIGLLVAHAGRRFRLASGGTIDSRDVTALDAQLTTDFRDLLGVLITEGRLSVDPTSTSGNLRGAFSVRPYGYATNIDFSVGMTTE
jgi:Protein of unknown function (DUF2586)